MKDDTLKKPLEQHVPWGEAHSENKAFKKIPWKPFLVLFLALAAIFWKVIVILIDILRDIHNQSPKDPTPEDAEYWEGLPYEGKPYPFWTPEDHALYDADIEYDERIGDR